MSVLANQTNATPGDAFFWRVNASTITANSFSSDRVLTNTLSTGSLIVGNISTTGTITVAGDINAVNISTGSLTVGDISTTGSIGVAGDITALNITATDTINSYFNNSQYLTSAQAVLPEIAGSNAFFYDVTSERNFLSSIVTNSINLDNNFLDTGGAGEGAVLLLNGYAIATISTSISSLQDWSFFPALSTVLFNNNNLYQVNNFSANTITTQTVGAFDATIDNQLTVGQTLFGNQSEFQEVITQDLYTNTLEATLGSISSLSVSSLTTNSVIIPTGTFSNITACNINTNTITAGSGNISNFGATTVNTGTVNASQVNTTNELVSGTLTVNEVRGVNGFIDVAVANRIRMRVLGSIDPFSSPNLDFEAGGGNRGIVNLIANPGDTGIQGEVNVTAKGGSALGYATGGLLNLTATRGTAVLGTANTSRVNIAADSITSYAGGPTPFVGVLGYNFVYGLLGVNIVAGTPPSAVNVPGTVYLYGLNPLGTGSSGGVRINNGMSIDVIYPYPQGFNTPPYDLFIRGTPSGQKVTLCNVRYLYGDGAEASGFNNINAININGTNLNGTTLSGTNLVASNVNVSSATISSFTSLNGDIQRLYNVSSINGASYPTFVPTQSTFNQLFTSSLQANNVSTITANITQISGLSTLNGYTVEQLISSVSPLVYFSTVSSFQQLYTSSLQANTISTNTANVTQLTGVSTLNGYTVEQLISSVSPLVYFSTVSTFQEIYTSSLYTSTIIGSDQFLITAGSSMSFSQTGTGSGLSINTSGNLVQLNSQVGLYLNAQGIININSGTYEGGTNINLQSDSEGAITFQTPSTICTGDITAATFNGLPLPTGIGVSTVSTFQELFTSSFVANTISTQTLTANQISSGSVVASTFNGYTIQQLLNPAVQSTFQTLFASTATIFELFASTGTIYNASNAVLNVSSINGFNTSQFLSTTGSQTQISTFEQLFTSSFQANSISSGTLAVSSLNGYNINQFINTPQLSTFQQLFTSSFQATSISSGQASIYSITGVSTINGFTVSEFVSSAAPPVPQLSTFQQFYTSSLAANTIIPYQTSDLTVAVPGTLTENVGNYNLTVASNIDINSSNALSIYNTNTAPPVGTNDLYILGQGTTTLAGQGTTNITAANNILVNAVATTGIQGQNVTLTAGNLMNQQANYVNLVGSNQVLLTSPEELRASSSNLTLDVPSGQSLIYLNQDLGIRAVTNKDVFITAINNIAISSATLTINGAPYGSVVSSFSTLATNTLTNNEPSPSLNILSRVAATISTGNTLLIDSGEILTYSRSLIDFFAKDGIALSTQTIYLDAINTNVQAALNAPQINTSTIVGNTITAPIQFASTIYTNTLRNNDSLGFELNIIAAYPSISSIATFIEGENFSVLATDQGTIIAEQFYISSGYTSIEAGDLVLQGNNSIEITSLTDNITVKPGFDVGGSLILRGNLDLCNNTITNVSNINLTNINGSPYTPGGGGTTVSTFQQLFTSSIVVNTINGIAYPPPDSNTISTFQQLFTSSITANYGTFSNIDFIGDTAELFADSNLQINATGTLTLGAAQGTVLLSLSNNIFIEPGFISPAQLVITGTTNLSNNNIINVNTLTTTNISTTNIATSNLFVAASTITSNLVVLNRIFNPSPSQPLQIQAGEALQLIGQTGLVLGTASNDILLTAGILDPGSQNVTLAFCDLNLSNNNINNVDVLTSGNIITTNLLATNLSTTNLVASNGFIPTLTTTTLNATNINASGINTTIIDAAAANFSTINTFPYHKAFGMAWNNNQTIIGAGGIAVDLFGSNFFNLSGVIANNISLLEGTNPLNPGIYNVNARVTFSNADTTMASAYAWLDINSAFTGDPTSCVMVQIEPNRIATANICWMGHIRSECALYVYSANGNVSMYEDPGVPGSVPRAYAANITLNQIYQNEGFDWPPNPIIE